MSKRKVKRVLLMVDYGEGQPDSGDVFDLTALVAEMLPRAIWSASISVDVQASKNYSPDPAKPAAPDLEISFGGNAGGEYVCGATHLDDVVNAALPDGERVVAIRNKSKRLRKKADELDMDAMRAKLEQVAGVRAQFPIARVSQQMPSLPGATKS